MTAFTEIRARIAEFISPAKPLTRQGVERFVKVRFFAPGLTMVETYDKENASDMAAWSMNQAIYPCQVVAQSSEPFV